MNLAKFLTSQIDQILSEWESFARTLLPAAATMSTLALRDHSRQILEAIAKDMLNAQSAQQQSEKSTGDVDQGVGLATAAAVHGALRQTEGFDLKQLFAEYRALRASVLRLWAEQAEDLHPDALYQMTRFNEAIDQALAESVARYSDNIAKSRDTFIAILGHDLRSPLQAVTVSATALASPGISDSSRSAAISRIQRGSQAMSQMISDLLEYTRNRLGKAIPVEPEQFNVAGLIRASLAEVQAGYPQRSFRVETGDDLVAFVDPPRMQQAITNLLTNAVRHGSAGASIELIARKEAEALVVQVRNKGLKISADALQAIFDPLVHHNESPPGESTRRSSNLGLGLFIAREIVLAHGGSIEAASSDDATVFTIQLPHASHERGKARRSSRVDGRRAKPANVVTGDDPVSLRI